MGLYRMRTYSAADFHHDRLLYVNGYGVDLKSIFRGGLYEGVKEMSIYKI